MINFNWIGLTYLRGLIEKKMSQKVEKVQKGGGDQCQKSKSPQFKMWTF